MEKGYILMIPSWYPNRENTHAGIFVKKHIQMISQFIDCYTLFVLPTNKLRAFKIEVEKQPSSEIIYFGATKSALVNTILYFLINVIKISAIILKKGRPKFVHNHVVFPSGFIAVLVAKLLNVRLIISEHWSGYLNEDNRFKLLNTKTQKVIRYILSSAYKIGLVSNFMKDRLVESQLCTEEKVIITPNKIELNNFDPVQRELSAEIKVLTICNLNDFEKNISGMIEAINYLIQNESLNIKLHIIGEGIDEIKLKELANEYGLLNSKVFFLGKIENHLLTNYYRNSDFYILNSNFETLNISTIEALMHGLPVVASKCGGPQDYLTQQNSIQVNTRDTNDLVRGIKEMLLKYNDYDREMIKINIENKYGEKVVEGALRSLYE
jgi:glycosyltransferase involved in cell wall biosynthesis